MNVEIVEITHEVEFQDDTSVHPETPILREARQLGDTDKKRNLLIHKLYDHAALCGPAVITARKLRLWTGTN